MTLRFPLIVLAAAAVTSCARSTPDRSPIEPGETTAADRDPQLDRPLGRQPEPSQRAANGPDGLPLALSGVFLEPTFSDACQLPPAPKTYFEFDSSNLDSRDMELLRRVAACLSDGPLQNHPVELVGYADPRGSDAYNRELGRSRAESVREFLRDRGVPAANISVRVAGEGFGDPLWPAGWAHDRRVDIRLLGP